MESSQALKKRNKELTKEIDKLRQQVQSQKYEIEALQNRLIAKEVLLRESDISKNDAKDVLEEMKAELERIGKRITKQLFRLKDPPLNEVIVPIYNAESLESVSVEPKSTSEGSRSEQHTIDHGSDREETILIEMSYELRKDTDIESDQGSSIRSVKTVINERILSRVDGKLQSSATSKQSVEDIPATKVEQPLGIQPHATRVTQTRDRNDELATQSDTNNSLLFTRPVQVKSPSGSELSDAEVLKSRSSRHTKELVAQPLPTQRNQRSELGVLKEPSTSAGCKTQDRKPTATQPDECEYMLAFKKITGKNRP